MFNGAKYACVKDSSRPFCSETTASFKASIEHQQEPGWFLPPTSMRDAWVKYLISLQCSLKVSASVVSPGVPADQH